MKVKMLNDGGFNIHKGNLKDKIFKVEDFNGDGCHISSKEFSKQGIEIDKDDGADFLWYFIEEEYEIIIPPNNQETK